MRAKRAFPIYRLPLQNDNYIIGCVHTTKYGIIFLDCYWLFYTIGYTHPFHEVNMNIHLIFELAPLLLLLWLHTHIAGNPPRLLAPHLRGSSSGTARSSVHPPAGCPLEHTRPTGAYATRRPARRNSRPVPLAPTEALFYHNKPRTRTEARAHTLYHGTASLGADRHDQRGRGRRRRRRRRCRHSALSPRQ